VLFVCYVVCMPFCQNFVYLFLRFYIYSLGRSSISYSSFWHFHKLKTDDDEAIVIPQTDVKDLWFRKNLTSISFSLFPIAFTIYFFVINYDWKKMRTQYNILKIIHIGKIFLFMILKLIKKVLMTSSRLWQHVLNYI